MNHQEFRNNDTGLVSWVEEDTTKPHGQPRYTVIRAGYWVDGWIDPNRESFQESCGDYVDGLEAFELALELVGIDKSKAQEELEKAHAKVRGDLKLPANYIPRKERSRGSSSNG